MGLFGELFDLGAEIIKVPLNIADVVTKPIREVAEEIAEEATEVVKDINDSIKE